MTIKFNTNNIIIIFFLSLSIAPAIFLGEGNRNLLLIGVMALSPLLILKYFKLDKIDLLLLSTLLLMLIVPYFANPGSYRISTVIYSIMFGLFFIAYKQLLYNSYFSINSFLKLVKYIIYAYFIVLVIQQFCVLTGLPIFNVSNYDLAEPFKLNSLSSEPSHTARIVALLMFSYIVLTEFIKDRSYSFSQEIKEDKYIWLAFLWVMLTSNSGTAFLFLAVIFLKFFQLKNIFFIAVLFLFSVLLLDYLNITVFQRTIDFSVAVFSLDIYTMMQVDHSASLRIAPMFVIFDQIDITNMSTWFGNGIDSTSQILDKYIYGVKEGFTGGGSLYLIYECGLITWILFMIFSFITVVRKYDLISFIFWVFLVVMYPLNSQIIWLCMVVFMTLKFYEKQKKEQIYA